MDVYVVKKVARPHEATLGGVSRQRFHTTSCPSNNLFRVFRKIFWMSQIKKFGKK